ASMPGWWLLLALLCHQLCPRGVAAARRDRDRDRDRDRRGRKEHPEPLNASLANRFLGPPECPVSLTLSCLSQLLEAAGARLTDPRRTWISFVHRPDDGSGSKRRCKGKDKKLVGFGPPGAPGAEVTREVLLQEFKEILKEAMEHRASLAIPAHPSPLPPLLLSLEEVPSRRRVEEAFHCQLQGQVLVDKKTLVELQNFQALRGLDLGTGRFTAPVGGIYQFSANIHIEHSELKGRAQLRARDSVRVLICIESLCHRHTSLEVIAGLESNSKIFTVYVHGLLQLQFGFFLDFGAVWSSLCPNPGGILGIWV
uniref:C1q and TNF related 12 n=1 Tax=Serinus canaria TaxID=9135 RepID=A0A8C9NZ04_SERCA